MSYEVPIDVTKIEALAKAFGDAAAQVDNLDAKVQNLNGTMGQTMTKGGRVVQAPSNPADGPATPGDARAHAPRGRSSSLDPYRRAGVRETYDYESALLDRARNTGDDRLIRDQENRVRSAQKAVDRADKDLFIGPPEAGASRPRDRAGPSSSIDPYGYVGPRARLTKDRAMLDRARGTGDDALTKDWEDRVKRSETAVKRLDNDPQQAKLDFLMTSRIGADGKMYPLVNRLLAAGGSLSTPDGASSAAGGLKSLGIGQQKDLAPMIADAAKAALPMLMTIGAGALAGGAVVGLAEMGSANLARRNAAFYTMGGSPGNVGAAMALGGPDAASKALNFGDRLREGSFGSSYFRSQGIFDGGPAQIDKSANYVRGIDALRRVKDDQTAIRIARDTGLTDDLWTRDIKSDVTYRQFRASMGDAGSQSDRESEAKYRAQKATLGNYWDRVTGFVGKQAMDFLTDPTGGQAFGERFLGDGNAKKGDGGGKRKGWQDVEPGLGNGPNTINGSVAGAFPVGWRGRALSEDLDKLNTMIGAF